MFANPLTKREIKRRREAFAKDGYEKVKIFKNNDSTPMLRLILKIK